MSETTPSDTAAEIADHVTVDCGALAGLLRDWLPQRRWFAGKGRDIAEISVASTVPLRGADGSGAAALVHAFARVTYADGDTETYQVPLSLRREPREPVAHALVGELTGTQPGEDSGNRGEPVQWFVYDAPADAEANAELLRLIADNETRDGLTFEHAPDVELTPSNGLVIAGEQSNTSVVYGDTAILKVFRKVAPGINPDLELTRALAEARNAHIARPLGWASGHLSDENGVEQPTTLAFLQAFLKGATDGWRLATNSVRDLYREADLHADEVGGDFAPESERLGAATARVHLDLARMLGSTTAGPEESAATARQMHARLDAALAVVPQLEPYADALRATYDQVGALQEPVQVQRIHGDYHLGQVMRCDTGWILLDFEGEPARPLAERTALMSPLRDIAGMLRSYDYAARALLAEGGNVGDRALTVRAREWSERNRSAFCAGYATVSGSDPRDSAVLLRAFELDKAVYEVVYEVRHRPSWLAIPMDAVARLAAQAEGDA